MHEDGRDYATINPDKNRNVGIPWYQLPFLNQNWHTMVHPIIEEHNSLPVVIFWKTIDPYPRYIINTHLLLLDSTHTIYVSYNNITTYQTSVYSIRVGISIIVLRPRFHTANQDGSIPVRQFPPSIRCIWRDGSYQVSMLLIGRTLHCCCWKR